MQFTCYLIFISSHLYLHHDHHHPSHPILSLVLIPFRITYFEWIQDSHPPFTFHIFLSFFSSLELKPRIFSLPSSLSLFHVSCLHEHEWPRESEKSGPMFSSFTHYLCMYYVYMYVQYIAWCFIERVPILALVLVVVTLNSLNPDSLTHV